VIALFGPPVALFLAATVVKGTAPIEAVARNFTSIPTDFLLGLVVLALLGNLWEETSWTGFVTARLQARYGPLRASLIVAPLFGLYHIPLFFIIGGLSDSPNHLAIADFPMYAAFLLIVFSGPMRILLTWLYNSTGGSLPIVALFHASINATGGAAILATFFAGVDGLLLYAALAVLALVVIVATRGRLGLPRTDRVGAQPSPGAIRAATRQPADRLRQIVGHASHGPCKAYAARKACDGHSGAPRLEINDFYSARQVAWTIRQIAADLKLPNADRLFLRGDDDPLCLALPSGPERSVMENLQRWLPAVSKYDPAWFERELQAVRASLLR